MNKLHKTIKSFVFFNRDYFSRIKVLQNGEGAICIIIYSLNKDSLQLTKTVSAGFSKESFKTIVGIYLKELMNTPLEEL